MEWALAVYDNADVLEVLRTGIETALPGTTCVTAINLSEAKDKLAEHGHGACRVIVCSVSARIDASYVPTIDRRELTGLDFIVELRNAKVKTPALLVAAFGDTERLAKINPVERTQLIGAKELAGGLISIVKSAVSPPTAASAAALARHIDVDIFLHLGKQPRWSMRGGLSGIEDAGVIDVSPIELETLAGLCDRSEVGTPKFLRAIGIRIYEALMANSMKTDDFEIKLQLNARDCGGLEFARIRFNVDETTHGILLETLAKPRPRGADFWTFRTPMFRKFGSTGGRPPLFKNPAAPRTFNCLLVEAATAQFAGRHPLAHDFPALGKAKREIEWIEELLLAQPEEMGIGKVKVLRYEAPRDGSFADALRDELAGCDYGLVHYAGHSEISEDDGAYLVLGGKQEDLLSVEGFAEWTTAVQFMFLSSCRSAGSNFIMRLVEKKVPAVAGYAWAIKDSVALEFAEAFYNNLCTGLAKRSIEHAFMQAKQALYRKHPRQAHWAAPLLFMQVFEPSLATA